MADSSGANKIVLQSQMVVWLRAYYKAAVAGQAYNKAVPGQLKNNPAVGGQRLADDGGFERFETMPERIQMWFTTLWYDVNHHFKARQIIAQVQALETFRAENFFNNFLVQNGPPIGVPPASVEGIPLPTLGRAAQPGSVPRPPILRPATLPQAAPPMFPVQLPPNPFGRVDINMLRRPDQAGQFNPSQATQSTQMAAELGLNTLSVQPRGSLWATIPAGTDARIGLAAAEFGWTGSSIFGPDGPFPLVLVASEPATNNNLWPDGIPPNNVLPHTFRVTINAWNSAMYSVFGFVARYPFQLRQPDMVPSTNMEAMGLKLGAMSSFPDLFDPDIPSPLDLMDPEIRRIALEQGGPSLPQPPDIIDPRTRGPPDDDDGEGFGTPLARTPRTRRATGRGELPNRRNAETRARNKQAAAGPLQGGITRNSPRARTRARTQRELGVMLDGQESSDKQGDPSFPGPSVFQAQTFIPEGPHPYNRAQAIRNFNKVLKHHMDANPLSHYRVPHSPESPMEEAASKQKVRVAMTTSSKKAAKTVAKEASAQPQGRQTRSRARK